MLYINLFLYRSIYVVQSVCLASIFISINLSIR